MTVPGQGQEPNPNAGQEPGGSTPNADAQKPPAGNGQEPSAQQQQGSETFTREYVEQLRQEAAGYRKRATEAEGKVTAHEREKLSESERLTAEVADWKARATDLESKYQTALIRSAVEREASKAGAIDPEVVYALIDRSDVKLGDDGAVSGADKAVEALLKAKPYLKAAEGQNGTTTTRTATRSIPSTPKSNGQPASRDELVKKTEQELAGTGRYRL